MAASEPVDICVGSDGNLWVSDFAGLAWKVTTAGVGTSYTVTSGSPLIGICLGSDDNIWLTDSSDAVWVGTLSPPPTPIVIRHKPFTFLFYDFLTGDFIGEIPLNNPSWGSVLNGVGNLSATINLADPRIRNLDVRSIIQSGKRAVFIDYGGHLVWGGLTVGPMPFTRSTRQITFSAMELWGYFSRRVQATDYSAPPYSGITGVGSTMPIWGYNGVGSPQYLWDPLLMAAQVIYDSLGVPNGNPIGGMQMKLNDQPISTSTATNSGVTGGYGGTLLIGSYAGLTATATLTSTTFNLTSVTPDSPGTLGDIFIGMAVTGSHIPSGTTVANVSGSTVTITNKPLSSTTETVTFGSGATPQANFASMTFPYQSMQPVATIVQQLTSLGYGVGPDIGVDVSWPGGFGVPQATINLNYPQRGRQTAGPLVVNAANCFDYTVTLDASTMANTVYETGGQNDIAVSQNINPLTPGAGGGYALFESINNHSQILSPNIPVILSELGIGDLILGSYPPASFSVVTDLWGSDPYYGSFEVGDDCNLMIDQDEYFINAMNQNQTWRITGYQVNLPDKGAATLTLTVGYPPPSGTYYTGPFINP